MAANIIYEPVVVDFISESALTINHGFGRGVNVQITDNTDNVIWANIYNSTLNITEVSFYESGSKVSLSGKVVIS